jgi:hypothetical protein
VTCPERIYEHESGFDGARYYCRACFVEWPCPVHEEKQRRAARGCLITLALCVLSALIVLGVLAWKGWWLEALSVFGILLVAAGLRSERGREDLGCVSPGWVERHR